MNSEHELPLKDENDDYFIVASLEYLDKHGIFPWDKKDEPIAEETRPRELSSSPLRSPHELLVRLLSMIAENGEVTTVFTNGKQISLPPTESVNLEKLSNQELLQTALQIAYVLAETFHREFDKFYMENPSAWDSWLAKVAHFLSKYRSYPNFIHVAETLIERDRVSKADEHLIAYGYPYVSKKEHKITIEKLRNSLNLIKLEADSGSQS